MHELQEMSSSSLYFNPKVFFITFVLMIPIVASPIFTATSVLATNEGDRSENANNFGEGASHLGKTGQMGDHSSNQDEPRSGIGNLGFPGDVADSLCPEDSDDPLCP
jgi:hypothetical protein